MKKRRKVFRVIAIALSLVMLMDILPNNYVLHKVQAASGTSDELLDGVLVNHKTKIYSGYENIGGYHRPTAQTIKDDYEQSSQRGQHPRLMITKDVVNNVLKKEISDSANPKSKLFKVISSRAQLIYDDMTGPNKEALLPKYVKCFENRMPGPYPNNTNIKASDEFKYRMMVLGLVYQLTDDSELKQKCVDAAWPYLERVTNFYESSTDSYDNFKDINPWHALDFSYYSQGLAIGYDWMYDAWTPERRNRIKSAILRLCLKVANDSYTPNAASQGNTDAYRSQTYKNATVRGVFLPHNHNAFVNSGIVMAALAVMDDYPQSAYSICQDAFICLERNLNEYYPSGLSNESSQYWLLTIDNLSMVFSSIETALEAQKRTKDGSLYGLDTCPGMTNGKPIRAIHAIESDVGMFSIGDTYDTKITTGGELYFYKHYNIHGFRKAIYDRVASSYEDYTRLVHALCWYEPESSTQNDITRDWVSPGNMAFATFRNHFNSKQSFLGVKAGTTIKDYFVHLDQGSFVFHSQGVKWAIDLGKDDYTVTGYNDTDNNRWNVFRLRPDGHNTLLINPKPDDYGYELEKTATLTTESGDKQAKAVVDMTDLVITKASSARRGFLLTDDRNSVVIRDEVTLKQKSDLYWVMYTQQSVSTSGNRATLTSKNNEKLTIDFAVTPFKGEFINDIDGDGILFEAEPWSLAPVVPSDDNHKPQNTNSDYKRIIYKVSNATGTVKITAKLTPVISETSSAPSVSSYGDIDTWNVNDTVLTLTGKLIPNQTNPRVNDILKVTLDGVNCDSANLQYRWYRVQGQTQVLVCNNPAYRVEDNAIGQNILCRVTDKTGRYTGELTVTFEGTVQPAVKPTATPTAKPTAAPTIKPTTKPTSAPTPKPNVDPTAAPVVDVTQIFADVPPGKWYVNAVQFVYEQGFMNGKGADPKGSGKLIFDPNANLTRAEFATVLYNKEGKPSVSFSNTIPDVKNQSVWYAKPVHWVYEQKIAVGYPNGNFGVADPITREQLALMLYKYAKLKGYKTTYSDNSLARFGDTEKISGWAVEAMKWATSNGVMNGSAHEIPLLNPKGNATRAECAAMIKSFIEKLQ